MSKPRGGLHLHERSDIYPPKNSCKKLENILAALTFGKIYQLTHGGERFGLQLRWRSPKMDVEKPNSPFTGREPDVTVRRVREIQAKRF